MTVVQRIGAWWKAAALGLAVLSVALFVQGCTVTSSAYSSGHDTAYGPATGYGSVFIGRNYGYRSPHFAFGPPYYPYRYGPPPAWFGNPRSGYPYSWRCGRYGFHCW
jgi:hypothetical protein